MIDWIKNWLSENPKRALTMLFTLIALGLEEYLGNPLPGELKAWGSEFIVGVGILLFTKWGILTKSQREALNRLSIILMVVGGSFLVACSGSFNLKGKVCLQEELCANKDKVFVNTIISILEHGRVILGINGLPCAELNLTKEQIKNLNLGDILTLSVKDLGNKPICPVKVSKYDTQARDYPLEEFTISSDQVILK